MAVFGRKKKEKKWVDVEQAPPKTRAIAPATTLDKQNVTSLPTTNTNNKSSKRRSKSPPPKAKMSMLPDLVDQIATSDDTSGEVPARALRMLFSLSENAESDNRTRMVCQSNLISCLLDYLKRCEVGSSEQYLALLVINNVSIPSENKRVIALECGGAQVLARLLCLDPSCHLLAIILVNLTFCDAELRKELVATSNVELIQALSFVLRVACMTQEEYDIRQPLSVPNEHVQYTPSDLLRSVIHDDIDYHNDILPLDSTKMLFPETARWCLSALKNLSRPSKESPASQVMVECGIVKHILRIVTIGEPLSDENVVGANHEEIDQLESNFTNAPSTWQSNSMQDAALFVIMNLAAIKSSRDYILELNGVETLTRITEYDKENRRESDSTDEQKQLDFQRLKARMTLAYFIASEGHFGQPRRRASTAVYNDSFDDSCLIVTQPEVLALLELLADSLQQRSKSGPGGFSAATFNVKWVLYAIRCLATHTLNQIQFANVAGVRLNVLLMKVLALHALGNSSAIDADAAEYAAFTLYLLSNRGFTAPFLPGSFGIDDRIAGTGSLSAKILTSFIHMDSITPAGRHAADQLLLRLRYLSFQGSVTELTSSADNGRLSQMDYALNESLLEAAEAIIVEKRKHGARPQKDVFDRPIVRSKAPKRGSHQAPWENGAAISTYPNALIAVQQLSFGSTRVRHLDAIDDVLIANNIANSANGEKTESYNYWWSWEENDIQQRLSRLRTDSSSMFGVFPSCSTQQDSFGGESDFPFSFFGCGSLCGTDTSVENGGKR